MLSPQEFVEQMGLASERDGLPRIAGRLFGHLILHEGPFSLDELADELQVSKASVSTNARMLEQVGITERVGRPGDRRDYYRLAPDAPERMFETARARMEGTRELLAQARADLPDDLEGAHERLTRMWRLYDFLLSEIDQTIERWKAGSARNASVEEAE